MKDAVLIYVNAKNSNLKRRKTKMKSKQKIRKKNIEKLLDKGMAMPIPYSDCVAICYEYFEEVMVFRKRYDLYKPTNNGKKFELIKDVKYFQKEKKLR